MDQPEQMKTLYETAVYRRLAADPGLTIESMTPLSCPVMMEMTLDGFPAIFRSRHTWWGMYVGTPGSDDAWNIQDIQVFRLEAYYDESPAAGYMPLETFLLIAEEAIAAFRKVRVLMPSDFQMKRD